MPQIQNVAIVSLSAGTLGEPFVQHELAIGVRRLEEMGLDVRFMPHALKGIAYVREHPEKRAADLLQALEDPSVDMILCAIGGDDTYRLLPHLFGHDELATAAAAASHKVFLGFSDTTINHLMLHKVGMRTYYGQAFLADVCEIGKDMLPYTRSCFEELVQTGTIRQVGPSDTWYESRSDFGPDQVGTPLVAHQNQGFILLQGSPIFCGEVLGGCIDTFFDVFDAGLYADMPALCERYAIFPTFEEWTGKILLLESSEEKMSPEAYRQTLAFLKEKGVFQAVSGILVGKPMDEVNASEYERALVDVLDDPSLPIVTNVNVGHAQPRCIIPFGPTARVDACNQVIRFD